MHPHSTGETIMGVLRAGELRRQREAQLYDTIFDLLSFEKILFNGGCRGGGDRAVSRRGRGGRSNGIRRRRWAAGCPVLVPGSCSAASGVGAPVVVGDGIQRAGSMVM